jgi:site-specific recombinase XerD
VRSYEARMKLHLAAAGLDTTLSPHALRHSRGMNIFKNHRGTDAVKVAQVALNHESIRSTGIYLHINREEYAKAIALVDAKGRLAKRDALADALTGSLALER